MKKATKEFLEQNGFVYENRDDGFRYNTQSGVTYKCYKQCYSRKYTSFEISFYFVHYCITKIKIRMYSVGHKLYSGYR